MSTISITIIGRCAKRKKIKQSFSRLEELYISLTFLFSDQDQPKYFHVHKPNAGIYLVRQTNTYFTAQLL